MVSVISMFSDPEKNIDQFSLGKGNYVADFGTGSGFYALAAAEAVGETGKVYAIDVQKDLLNRLKNEARTIRHLMNLEVIWADLDHFGGTRLRDASLDAVIASNVFSQLEHKDNAAMEIGRTLKKGGRALIIDWSGAYTKVGPAAKDIFSITAAKELFKKYGLEEDREIFPGGQHYGVILRKK